MENKENIFETQLVGSSEPEIVKIPYQQDSRWAVSSTLSDAVIYDGKEGKRFKLDPTWLDYRDCQELESYVMYDLRCADEIEMRSIFDLEHEEMRRSFRQFIRKTYPLYVTLVPGVLYSPSRKVILETFGKVKFIEQQKIDPRVVFKNYSTPPKKMYKAREALREIQSRIDNINMEGENSQRLLDLVESSSSPIAGPSSGIRTPIKRRLYSEVVAGVDHSESTGKKFCLAARRLEFPPLESESQNIPQKKLNLFQKTTRLEFDLFDSQLFDLRFDKKHVIDMNKVEETPNPETLEKNAWRWKNDRNLKIVKTVGVGSSVYGDGFANINFVKLVNSYTAHVVNFSIREMQEALPVIIEEMCEALNKLSLYHKEKSHKEALIARMVGKGEEAKKIEEEADALFKKRQEAIEKRKNPLKEIG